MDVCPGLERLKYMVTVFKSCAGGILFHGRNAIQLYDFSNQKPDYMVS